MVRQRMFLLQATFRSDFLKALIHEPFGRMVEDRSQADRVSAEPYVESVGFNLSVPNAACFITTNEPYTPANERPPFGLK